MGCQDIGKRKSKFVAKTQLLNPLVTRPVTISEVVLEGSCQNKTWLYSWKNYIQLNFWFFFCTGWPVKHENLKNFGNS